MKPGYKQTEVGVIPVDWDSRRIGDDIDLLTGFPFSSSGYANVGIRLLRGSNVKRGQTDWTDAITQYWPSLTPDVTRYELKDGDLVIAMDGSLVGRSFARISKDDLPAVLLQRVARIRSKKLDVTYLTAFVGSDWFIKYADSVKTVTAIPHISPADIRNFSIPVPPTSEEQRAIAAALSDVDALLAALDRLIAKKRAIKQAAMQQLLTGQSRLPGFTGEWAVKTLGEVVQIHKGQLITGKSLRQGEVPVIAGGKQPAYFHAVANRHGRTITISASGASAGYVALYNQPIFASDCSTISESSDYSLDFIFFQLLNLQQAIYKAQTGGAQPHIHAKDLNPLTIPVPPLSEQTAIAEVLSEMDAELAALEQRRDKTRALKQGMMQELLTGRTRLI